MSSFQAVFVAISLTASCRSVIIGLSAGAFNHEANLTIPGSVAPRFINWNNELLPNISRSEV